MIRAQGGGLGKPTGRDQRSWVLLNNQNNTWPVLTENPDNSFRKAKT